MLMLLDKKVFAQFFLYFFWNQVALDFKEIFNPVDA